jgi:NADPH:quinone reductase-like Zn-dependent oxidoreductase
MFAAYATAPDADDPLAALLLGERPEPVPEPGWVTVRMRAASLNMHDIGTLRGVRMRPEQYPLILGCDGAGVLPDGTEVVVHPCVNDPAWVGPETLDPHRSVLSERYPGTFAELVAVPARNVVPKPASLSFAEAACTGTAWLTAYRMLFVHSGLRPGQHALVQGRLGSIGTGLVELGTAAGMTMWTQTESGAHPAGMVGSTSRPPVSPPTVFDAVFDAGVDEAAWSHALRRLRPGGALVCAGYRSGATTTGYSLEALHRLIFSELRVVGSAMGTRDDLVALLSFLDSSGLRPAIGLEVPLAECAKGMRAMLDRTVTGKIVFSMPA